MIKSVFEKIFLCFFCLFIFSCQNEAGEENAPSIASSTTQGNVQIQFVTYIDYLRLREKPGEDGKTIAMINQGDTLQYLQEVSNFSSKIKLRDIWMEEPWLKIATNDSLQGWVYAGGVRFLETQLDYEKVQDLLANRIISFLGNHLALRVLEYQKQFQTNIETSQDFANIYLMGENLRDSILPILHKKIKIQDPGKRPDLSWLEMVMPGYLTQLVAEGTTVHLFKDFRVMNEKASQTTGGEDDEFIDLCIQIFPLDSLEYFYSGWFLQTWDYGGHSELGSGKHLAILKKMNKLDAERNFFEWNINQYKDDLLNDITNAEMTYWNSKKAILEEMKVIIATDLGILSREDKMTLEVRKKMFEKAEANKIELNHRSGIHDN